MKKTTRTILGCAFLVSMGALANSAGAERRAEAETDREGRVVRRADGERVRYAGRPAGRRAPAGARPFGPAAALAPQALAVTEEWRFHAWGDGMGVTGLHVVDLDADGDREIVAGSGRGFGDQRYWYVASRRADGSFEQDWSSDEYPDDVTSVAVAQVDADPALEVLIGSGGRVLVYDGATRQIQWSWSSPAVEVTALTVADVDADGVQEAIFCDSSFETDSLYVYALATGVQEFAGRGYGCTDIAVGNVDADPGPEIVVAHDWDLGFVLDGTTRALQWSNSFGFGLRVALGDVDADGRMEVVAGPVGRGIGIFDAHLQSLERTIATEFGGLEALEVLDVEGDGPLEIAYGDDQWGDIHVLNGQTGAVKWEVDNPEHGVTGIAFGNLDGDPQPELVWGAGYTSTGPDYLYVVDTVTRLRQWASLDLDGPFRALAFGDVDADGRFEILYGNLELATFGSGPWFVRDALTKALEYQLPVPEDVPFDSEGLWRIASANADADPQQEIFTTRVDPSTGQNQLASYDGLTHAVQWAVSLPLGARLVGLRAASVDADPALELVVTTEDPTRVFVLAAANGAVEWESPSFTSWEPALLRIGNVDADPNPEIVFAGVQSFLFVIDGVTHAFNNLGDFDITSLDLADRNGDGVQEMFVGTDDGRVLVVGAGGSVLETLLDQPESIDGLRVADVTGDGIFDLVYVTLDTIHIRDGAGGAELWSSGQLRYTFFGEVGSYDSLVVDDVDGDGRLEIFVGLGTLGVRIYEIPQAADLTLSGSDAPDPALVGSNLTYTWTVTNPSALFATNVGLVATLPAGATFVSSTPGAPACAVSSGTLTCALGGLGPTTSTNVTVLVTPTAPGTLASSAVVTADQADPDATNNAAAATTTVTSTVQADLAAAIDDGRVLVGTGEPLTYALSVGNLGPWPVTSVRLLNPLPAALESPVYTPAVGTYAPSTGVWSGLDLQAGTSAQMTLTATVGATAAGVIWNPLLVQAPAGVDDLVVGNDSALDANVVAVDRTELQHGTTRVASLDAAGDRYFAISQRPYSSYEVVVDEVSGDVGELVFPLRLERLSSGLDVLTDSAATGVGFSRSLRWLNTSASTVDGEAVRVRSGSCTTDCGPDDAFRVRAYDTTYDLPRFNNANGQGTVVVLQNNGGSPASGRLYFWSASGALLASAPFTALPAHGVLVVNTAALAGTAGLTGSITVANDAPYGTLAGKAVAVDPATGAAFDTLLRARPR